MFEFVRRNTRWLMGGILVLLVIAFAAPTGYTSFMEASAGSVASVDGQKITQVEWDAEHRRYADRMRNQNPQIDNKLLDSDEVKMQSLKG
ncbi:MAG: SurA N-terminal domain-containing protein, partial [Inhella sp.]|uniref:SurA N-terminal domain-containing protein n=1 Tax=Inhella sp. TaxID=1921806 RepID=UPI00391DB47B